jgi:2,4-dienoyl-CoA reductase-like NADH-dependent reductase (Old Yellow Enzyme family)
MSNSALFDTRSAKRGIPNPTEKAMNHPAPKLLFRPYRDSVVSLPNRIVMSPMSRYRSPGGIPNDANVEYYRRRARAGVGMIITEATYIDHPVAGAYENVPTFFGAQALAGWRNVASSVHQFGSLIVPQLWHVGAVHRLGRPSRRDLPGLGPGKIVENGITEVRAAGETEIADIIASFARGAQAAKSTGFDGVAVHGAHGYLIDQFLWSGTNRRRDRYGGSTVDRARLAVEIVRAIRATTDPSFPIVFRYSQWKAQDYDARIAANPRELEMILAPLVDAGVDIFDVSSRRFYVPAFEGDGRSLAAWTRQISGKTTIGVGSIGLDQPHQSKYFRTSENVAARITDLKIVEEALERGDFDLAGVGRALLADCQWAEKARKSDFENMIGFSREAMDNYD